MEQRFKTSEQDIDLLPLREGDATQQIKGGETFHTLAPKSEKGQDRWMELLGVIY
ncbi:MAG: hypothetical protein IJV08_03150 [Bacteroidaceae bacterium]|nr:hypothetical protein [Bacteroidaceae bacterium]